MGTQYNMYIVLLHNIMRNIKIIIISQYIYIATDESPERNYNVVSVKLRWSALVGQVKKLLRLTLPPLSGIFL